MGGLLIVTNPRTIMVLLKELGAARRLIIVIGGESLMNYGVTIVAYRHFFQVTLGNTFNAAQAMKLLFQFTLGLVVLGLAFGLTLVLWLCIVLNDILIRITNTLIVSYLNFTVVDSVGFLAS